MENNEPTEPLARSEYLAVLRPLFEEGGLFEDLGDIFQVSFILDANVVLADIRWMALHREKSEIAPQILEVLQAGTVKAFAPTYLKKEIRTHLPRIAKNECVSLKLLESFWELYKPLIEFVDVGGPQKDKLDPKDAPYIALQEKLEFRILSKDKDIPQMGGSVVNAILIARLRDYSREAAVKYSLKVAGLSTIYISGAMIKALVNMIGSIVKSIPPGLWLLCIAVFGMVLSSKSNRDWLMNVFNTPGGYLKSVGDGLLEFIEMLVSEYEGASEAASTLRETAEKELDG